MKVKIQTMVMMILVIITIVAVSITAWVLLKNEDVVLTPDYAPQENDKHAEELENKEEEKLDTPEGGGAVSLTYSIEVGIHAKNREISLFFQNPGKSTQDIVLQLAITKGTEDIIIAQSGKIPSGYQLKTMKLFDGITLSPGGYHGKFILLCYNQESGEKSIVNQEVIVNITVEE